MAKNDVAKALARIEDELIGSMMRNLANHRAKETEEGLDWTQWQVEQMAALQEYKAYAAKKYGIKFLDINQNLKLALEKSYKDGQNEEELIMLEAMLKGAKIEKDSSFFGATTKNIDSMIEAISGDFERAEYALLRRSEDIYRKTILDAQFYALSGAGTYEKAIDMATRDFLRKGIDCIQYKNGRRVSISTYAEMALRTGGKRAALMGQGDKRKEWGHSLVKINKRGNPCPLCAPFVGKVMIDDVYSGGKASDGPYPLLSSAIAAGLYHPNCKDGHSTYFPELGDREEKLTKEDLEDIQKEASKDERIKYCDRKIDEFSRKEKYFLDPENKRVAGVRKEQWEKERELHYRAYKADELFEVESTSLLKEHLSKFYSVAHQGFSRERISEFFNDVYNLGELDFPGAPEEFKNVNILLAKRDISRILFEHGDQMSNEEFNLIFSLSDQVDEVLLMNDRKENSIMVYKNIPGKDDRVMEAIIIKKEGGGHIIHFMKTSRRRQRKIEKKYKKLFNSTE